MKLEYKILWVEDNPKSIRRDKGLIKEYIENFGFICDIQEINNFSSFERDIGYPNTSKYDLLLIDLDLGNQETKDEGNTIIKKIRDEQVYTEIIFYSSQYEELNRKLNEHFVEGIFTSSRNELEDKVQQIIDITIKKTQDVNNLRGLIMAEVAELDRIKEQIIINATSKINDKELEKYILKKVKSSLDSNTTKLDKFNSNIDDLLITELLGSRGLIDSDKKRLAVGETLEKLRITEPIDKKTFLEPYKNNILTIRNNFAHVEESDGLDEEGNTCTLIGSIPFTEKKCIEIRQEIKKYKDILLEIKQKLNE